MKGVQAMSPMLVEAIKQLDLKPGEKRQVSVNGYLVELRRVQEEEESDLDKMVMLEPWFELPDPPIFKIVRPKPGPIDRPDPPVIPSDEELS